MFKLTDIRLIPLMSTLLQVKYILKVSKSKVHRYKKDDEGVNDGGKPCLIDVNVEQSKG